MRILSYRKMFGNMVSTREVLIEHLHLVIGTLGVSFACDMDKVLAGAMDIEEVADEHISLPYVESLASGVRQGMFCVRELQQTFGIQPEGGNSFLIIVDETRQIPP